MSRKYLWQVLVIIVFVVVLAGCEMVELPVEGTPEPSPTPLPPTPTPDKQLAWDLWAQVNKPQAPVINVTLPKVLTKSAYQLVASEQSRALVAWKLTVDGTVLVEAKANALVHTINLAEGDHAIEIVATAAVSPPEWLAEYGPTTASSVYTTTVAVDTVPPAFTVAGSADNGIIRFTISAQDTAGICCGSVDGLTDKVGAKDSSVIVELPEEKVGITKLVRIAVWDVNGNASTATVAVPRDPDRWEKVSKKTGELVAINTTPGFNPYTMACVGGWRWFWGWGDYMWVQYVNGAPQPATGSGVGVYVRWSMCLGAILLVVGFFVTATIWALKVEMVNATRVQSSQTVEINERTGNVTVETHVYGEKPEVGFVKVQEGRGLEPLRRPPITIDGIARDP